MTPPGDHQISSGKLYRREQTSLQLCIGGKPEKHIYRLMKKPRLNRANRPVQYMTEARNK